MNDTQLITAVERVAAALEALVILLEKIIDEDGCVRIKQELNLPPGPGPY